MITIQCFAIQVDGETFIRLEHKGAVVFPCAFGWKQLGFPSIPPEGCYIEFQIEILGRGDWFSPPREIDRRKDVFFLCRSPHYYHTVEIYQGKPPIDEDEDEEYVWDISGPGWEGITEGKLPIKDGEYVKARIKVRTTDDYLVQRQEG